jgi:hypothetical protein
MAQAKTRSSTRQKRATQSANGSSGSASKSRSASASKPRSSTKAKSAGASRSNANRSNAGKANASTGGGSKAAVVAGLATGAAGLIGGAVLGTRFAKKPKKVLGIPVPGTGGGIDGLAKQVGKAGKQFKKASKQVGDLTDEVRAAREKAEQIGKAIS